MALTCGFFNSINKDRLYDAIQFGQIFDGIIADGVYATYLKGMVVIASDNPNEVIIQPGRAWFNHTWSYNDANLPFEAPEPEVLLDRIDTLVLDVNLEQAERNNTYIWVQGTPSSQNPQPPALIRSVTHNQYPLCDVYRKAGTTMIYTKDITNRIGTSDTPFATGVLEGIDLDMWINQWDNEFHTWEIDTKAEFDAWELNSKNSFETWMISQQQVYTAWFDSIKDQMSDDLAEFEAWFETIKDIIDESAALHLQAEIDEINKMLPSGSHITITTENTELFGRNVTVTDGTHPTIVKFDNSGVAEVETYPYVGNITITSTDGIRTATTTTHIPYFGRYSYGISFWAAVVNIIGDEEFANYPVTVKNSNGDILTTIILDSSAQGTWTAIEPDTYTFSVTYGGETMEVSLNVTQETTYTVEIHAQPTGFDFEEWLTAGDVSGTYADLDAVLADEVAVRKLMTKHASVDYLASFTDEDESVIKILNNDLCAKWISLRDYAMDVLEAAYSALMGTIGKYGYGEWALQNAVPVMSSNTAPYGEASASDISATGYEAYRAFDRNISTMWHSNSTTSAKWLQYSFTERITAKKVYIHSTNFERFGSGIVIQGSNDNFSTYAELTESIVPSSKYIELNFTKNIGAYNSYRVYCPSCAAVNIQILQLYAYSAKGAVPIMTSDIAPYGTVIRSSVNSSSVEAWKAFDGNTATYWNSAAATDNPAYVGYKFTNPVKAKKARVYFIETNRFATVIMQGSNDNSTWVDLTEDMLSSMSVGWNEIAVTKNDGYYLYYRMNYGRTNYASTCELQVYGRELKVSVPKMISNTSPYGEAFGNNSGSSASKSGDYYNPFKESPTAIYYKGGTGMTDDSYIGYTFTSKVKILAVFAKAYNGWGTFAQNAIIQGSNDGTTWVDVGTGEKTFSQSGTMYFVSNPDMYSQYRLKFTNYYYSSSYNWIGVAEIRFYGFDYSEYDWDTEHPRHYIYDHGLELDTFVKASYCDSSAVVEKRPSEILLQIPSPSGSKQSAIAKTIDLTDYELMRMCVGDEYVNGTYESLGIYNTSYSVVISRLRPLSGLPYNAGVDTSSVNGTYEIVIETSNKLTVTEWWLE